MSERLQPSAQRFQDLLTARGLALEVVELPASTRTAAEAARAIGCRVEQIVKSLVFRGRQSGRGLLVVASGANRVSETRLSDLAGEAVEKASAAFVRDITGFAVGGVPPIGHAAPLVTFIDADLLAQTEVWAAAGTPHAVFRLSPSNLVALTGGQVAELGEPQP